MNYLAGFVLTRLVLEKDRKFGYQIEIMGASFRNTGEILELAGGDLLTIGPPLLEQLSRNTDLTEPKLTPEGAQAARLERVRFDEKSFRVALNEDEMATEKMAEAIRQFAVDTRRLEKVVEAKL